LIIAFISFSLLISAVLYSIHSYRQKKISRLEKCSNFDPSFKFTKNEDSSKKVVLIGDSRVVRWREPDFGDNATIFYRIGISGGTSKEILCAAEKAFIKNADLYIIQVGINDLVAASLVGNTEQQKIKQRLLENIRTLVKSLSVMETHILILSIVPPLKTDIFRKFVWGKTISKDAEEVSQILQNEVTGKTTFYDMKKIMYNFHKKKWKKSMALDALHWKKEVYDALNSEVKEIIRAH
jgi:lysophospholipase L1-like esterase